MSLFEARIEIVPATVEVADNALLELGAASWSVLEDVIVKRAWLVGVGESDARLHAEWRDVSPALAAAGVTTIGPLQVRALGDADWRDSYKAHFHAWRFGRLHWVPVWERPSFQLPAGDAVLWLDPGLAFGTGNHETTRLCIERLVAIDAQLTARGWSRETAEIIDAGCGSGILALSAALLGFQRVEAFDNDPEAVRVSKENAELNGLSGRVEFFVGDLTTGLTGRQAHVLLANIQADVLMAFADALVAAVRPGGVLILSGILATENAAVQSRFNRAAPNWTVSSRVMGEWSDVVLEARG